MTQPTEFAPELQASGPVTPSQPTEQPEPAATPAPAAPLKADAIERDRRKAAAEALMLGQVPANTPAIAPNEEPFIRAVWSGYEQFRCKFCPWDTLHEALAFEHFSKMHGPNAVREEEE